MWFQNRLVCGLKRLCLQFATHRYHAKSNRRITDKTQGKDIKTPSVRYADDMVIVLRPQDDANEILGRIDEFLAIRGMKVSEKKTKITDAKDGFDFLGWNFKVKANGKLNITPSVENFKKFREKVKNIVNCSNYGSKVKAEKLAPIVRGWRNYHRFCDMSGSRFSLWFMSHRAHTVFNKETKNDRESSVKLVQKAFPTVPSSLGGAYVMVKGNKSPYDGDLTYWSQRNSKLYDGTTSKALQKQNHSCGQCGMKLTSEERVHLHHIDGNHDNWKPKNLQAIHESCHDYLHMGKSES
ncbi:RNA-directed DNA polymerase [Nostoc flagelliforme CCNUN1]|uniref:RNA-directed DNA polymerase n=1 Tax=Nostoc flagelliforme CCNUN1 TaxID=2038116 RepID=A0A2K8SIP5_9NOSO|nr:RNA-directed DNA polymerase [Nostoc flagelliforme CCNUN1]